MARFLCAVHAPDATPRGFALVEVLSEQGEPTYAVRDLRRVTGEAPFASVLAVLRSEPQYVAQTTVVTTGGQASADAFRAHGPSAVAVHLGTGGADAHDVAAQVLVDTFEGLFRAGAVEVPGALDAASEAVDALYSAADLEAAAADSDRDRSGALDGDRPSSQDADASERHARIAAATGAAVDLGEHEDIAVPLGLAVWYGEASRDALPQTDQADEASANRRNRQAARR